jgi:hypothetical protein
MRFDPDARRKAVSMPPRDTQALYHQHVAGRSELDQLWNQFETGSSVIYARVNS